MPDLSLMTYHPVRTFKRMPSAIFYLAARPPLLQKEGISGAFRPPGNSCSTAARSPILSGPLEFPYPCRGLGALAMSAPMWTQADAPSPMFLQNPAIRQAAKTRNSTGVPKGRRPFRWSECVTGPEQQTELTRSTTQPEQLGVDPILLYDGACGFCTASVQFILAHERQQSLRFASLQGAMASAIRATHPKLTEVDSIVWLESSGKGDAKLWFRSAAALRVAWYMGGLWRFAGFGAWLSRSSFLGYNLPHSFKHTRKGRTHHGAKSGNALGSLRDRRAHRRGRYG
ncbi:MAG: hypothetical protein DMG14_16785 [Acidobacteria bacterium]|nr:MAG: hypothetical protein DMG14_16785 [Acidobacteriota bacterium]